MLNERQQLDFEKWAKKRSPFSYNKYTKRLICMSNHWDDVHESFKLDAYANWLDDKDFHVSVSPHIGGGALTFYAQLDYRYNDFICRFENVMNGKEHAYFSTRFEATKEALNLALKLEDEYAKQI